VLRAQDVQEVRVPFNIEPGSQIDGLAVGDNGRFEVLAVLLFLAGPGWR